MNYSLGFDDEVLDKFRQPNPSQKSAAKHPRNRAKSSQIRTILDT